jgi:predicted RNA-binding protein (TIGR00451 family)
MQGADLIARTSKKFPHVIVNETAEKLILYGRDVLGQSIVEASEMLRENEIVILLNRRNEPIGIGRTKVTGASLTCHGKGTVVTLLDAGYYLRSEGKSKRSYRVHKPMWK